MKKITMGLIGIIAFLLLLACLGALIYLATTGIQYWILCFFGMIPIEVGLVANTYLMIDAYNKAKNEDYALKYGTICKARPTGTHTQTFRDDSYRYNNSYTIRTGNPLPFGREVTIVFYDFIANGVAYSSKIKPAKVGHDEYGDFYYVRVYGNTAAVFNKLNRQIKTYPGGVPDSIISNYISTKEPPRVQQEMSEKKKKKIALFSAIVLISLSILAWPVIEITDHATREKPVQIDNINHWSDDIKADMMNILGEVLPEYEFNSSSSFYLSKDRQKTYDGMNYMYPSTKESTLKLYSTASVDDVDNYVRIYLANKGYTKDELQMYCECYNSPSLSGSSGYMYYARFKKGNKYVVVAMSTHSSTMYYEYATNYVCSISKGIYITYFTI